MKACNLLAIWVSVMGISIPVVNKVCTVICGFDIHVSFDTQVYVLASQCVDFDIHVTFDPEMYMMASQCADQLCKLYFCCVVIA